MSNDRTRRPAPFLPASAQMGEGEADYSYDQWRHAQMRQLEQNYARLQIGVGQVMARGAAS